MFTHLEAGGVNVERVESYWLLRGGKVRVVMASGKRFVLGGANAAVFQSAVERPGSTAAPEKKGSKA